MIIPYDPNTMVVTINGERYSGITPISYGWNAPPPSGHAALVVSSIKRATRAQLTLDAEGSRELRAAIATLRKAQRLESIRADLFRAFKEMVGHLFEFHPPSPAMRRTQERGQALPFIRQPGLANRFPRIHASSPRQAVPSRTRRRRRTWER